MLVRYLETHLGLAAKGLGEKIDVMLQEQRKIAELREFLEEIYNGDGGRKEDLKSFSDEEIIEMAGNLRGGVPMPHRYLMVLLKLKLKTCCDWQTCLIAVRCNYMMVVLAKLLIVKLRLAICTF